MRVIFLAFVCCMTGVAFADTVYLCRSYGGGEFWSQVHCNERGALVQRITTVPSGLNMQQQATLAAASKAESEKYNPSNQQPASSGQVTVVSWAARECASLGQQIQALDKQIGQLMSGQTQDRLIEQRKKAEDRRFALRCR